MRRSDGCRAGRGSPPCGPARWRSATGGRAPRPRARKREPLQALTRVRTATTVGRTAPTPHHRRADHAFCPVRRQRVPVSRECPRRGREDDASQPGRSLLERCAAGMGYARVWRTSLGCLMDGSPQTTPHSWPWRSGCCQRADSLVTHRRRHRCRPTLPGTGPPGSPSESDRPDAVFPLRLPSVVSASMS
jgi:hypothetical protein